LIYYIEYIILTIIFIIDEALIIQINHIIPHLIISFALLIFSSSHQLNVSIKEPITIDKTANIPKYKEILLVHFFICTTNHHPTFTSFHFTNVLSFKQLSKFLEIVESIEYSQFAKVLFT
jgi:hypothetical protein